MNRIGLFVIFLKREDPKVVSYQTIEALVNQIPVDTWEVLREIKARRPAIMLSELIDCRRRALQQEATEPPSPADEPIAHTPL